MEPIVILFTEDDLEKMNFEEVITTSNNISQLRNNQEFQDHDFLKNTNIHFWTIHYFQK